MDGHLPYISLAFGVQHSSHVMQARPPLVLRSALELSVHIRLLPPDDTGGDGDNDGGGDGAAASTSRDVGVLAAGGRLAPPLDIGEADQLEVRVGNSRARVAVLEPYHADDAAVLALGAPSEPPIFVQYSFAWHTARP